MECTGLRYLNPIYTVSRAMSADLKRCNLRMLIERVILSVTNAFVSLRWLGVASLFPNLTYWQAFGLISATTFTVGAFTMGVAWLIQKNFNPSGLKNYELVVYNSNRK